MKLQVVLILTFFSFVVTNYTCSTTDCHECIGDTCNLTCQGEDCRDCPNGDCCDGDNCNVCVASVCCLSTKCNECVNTNRESCYKEASSATCDELIGEKCGLRIARQVFDISRNYNGQHHNITTIIKIRNLINNTNLIDAPIRLNLTSVNDVLLNDTGRTHFKEKRNCCSIVHPQECHQITGIPNKICFTRRHSECSRLCGNATNLVIKDAPDGARKCIVIAAHPYYYCGYYSTEDCSACFTCKRRSKIECLEASTCSNTCRSSVLPAKFYNVPYYIRTTSPTTETPGTPEAQR